LATLVFRDGTASQGCQRTPTHSRTIREKLCVDYLALDVLDPALAGAGGGAQNPVLLVELCA
jgi:hypothetical protein